MVISTLLSLIMSKSGGFSCLKDRGVRGFKEMMQDLISWRQASKLSPSYGRKVTLPKSLSSD